MDILLSGNRRGGGFKRLVRHQIQFMRCENERIPRNPRHRLIRAGQTAVNDEQAAAGADRAFALPQLDRHMTVDNETRIGQTKLAENAQRGLFVILEIIIRILVFDMRRLIRSK